VILEFKEINDTHLFLLRENVTFVNINGCHKVRDQGVISISQNCRNLEKLGKRINLI
jgi:hypothetical protein